MILGNIIINYTMTTPAVTDISVAFKEHARFGFINTLAIIPYTFLSNFANLLVGMISWTFLRFGDF